MLLGSAFKNELSGQAGQWVGSVHLLENSRVHLSFPPKAILRLGSPHQWPNLTGTEYWPASWEIFALDLPSGCHHPHQKEFSDRHSGLRFCLSNPSSRLLPSQRRGASSWFAAFPAQSHFLPLLSFENVTLPAPQILLHS